ncbi:glycosyltransferase family 4 protein [Halanaeroarchaeum sulfurireducens]|uniref:Group 1 glycosyl transferase n=1 Tax=Halanaeroarchaeum sulfurireducens TaxID=1604004 RepID=A0A0F7PBA1_9EURY|nr:glycosyltransferase family 4 protein [Halanaeroarchaeum sulfurireducens]AKH97435.1 group 1 glycosyl transferase [Halanaeroarchaeum sulfurireducens]
MRDLDENIYLLITVMSSSMSQSLRVLIATIDYPPPPGGIQTVTKNLESGLKKIGHKSTVLYLDGETNERSIRDLFPHPKRIYGVKSLSRRDYVYMNSLYNKTVEYIEKFNPHVVHAMHINNWSAMIAAADQDIPTVLSTHALELKNESLARTAIGDANLIHTPSEFTSVLIKDIQPNAESYIVPPPIDLDKYQSNPISEEISGQSGPVVSMARFVDRKNIETVIEAWETIDQSVKNGRSLIIVGDGPNRSKIESRVCNSTEIHLTGWISEEQKQQLLSEASGFVLVPRRDGYDVEGFGIVYIEAQASRTPIVGSKRGGVPEAVGNAGILVDDENDPQEVATAIETILTDETVRTKILEAAENRVNKFDLEEISDRHVHAYQQLL